MPKLGWWKAALAALVVALLAPMPAQAKVTITFWSHEFGSSFPHAFITLYGTPDAGGPAVDGDWGFTAVSVSPALLFGSVAGKLEGEDKTYLRASDAQFSLALTDAQYADILALMHEWGPQGDSHYNLNNRNCISFVQEAARRAGLTNIAFPKLMKRPRSFLLAVAAANADRVTNVGQHGDAYFAAAGREPPSPALPPVPMLAAVAPAPVTGATAAQPSETARR